MGDTKSATAALARALEKNTTLQVLDISYCNLEAADLAVFACVLEKNTTLQRLGFDEHHSMPADLEQTMFSLLKRNQLVFPLAPLFS
jgi:hypothetical protein